MKPRFFPTTLAALLLAATAYAARAESYGLDQLLRLAATSNPGLQAARDSVQAARSDVISAGAFPNPEIEYLGGNARARTPGTNAGHSDSVTLTQRLDLPPVRSARIDVADAGLAATHAASRSYESELAARIKLAYYELNRRQAEQKAAREDLSLMEAIRNRVRVRVETGEAPRYELIKADAELLNAQKALQSAQLRNDQAKALLRQAVGAALPPDFNVAPATDPVPPAPLDALRQTMMAHNPDLAQIRAEADRSQRQLELERRLRLPEVALKATRDTDPDLRTNKLGVAVTIPLWDRRSGPIGSAVANLSRARNRLTDQEFAQQRALETAYQQYQIANSQVTALEQGILRQAESALKVAEAAYRFGERGILDYLDAQRVYRAARNELITARYELRAALVDIDRLVGTPLTPRSQEQ